MSDTASRRDMISDQGSSIGTSSFKTPSITSSIKRFEPVHRSFSVHGSITISAKVSDFGDAQQTKLPFFATVCRSLFTAAVIDPITNIASGSQQSSGQLVLDFGSDSIIGGEYHRDILLVNRSEIELIWSTAVVHSRYKDQVWFSLRDLDSENVFGVGSSQSSQCNNQPLPLPALSSRHLRLELRVKEPVENFAFDFVITNMKQAGNFITCKAIGSGSSSTVNSNLKILSGSNLDFGQICDGIWGKKLITCKNDGERPLDVQFSCTSGYDVVFRLAGVAGEDIDEDLPIETDRGGRSKHSLSRVTTRERDRGRERETSMVSVKSRNESPSSSVDRPDLQWGDRRLELPGDTEWIGGNSGLSVSDKDRLSNDGRDLSRPPSRALSRVTSRTSSYRYQSAIESDDEDDTPFVPDIDQISVSPSRSYTSSNSVLLGSSLPSVLGQPPVNREDQSPDTFGDKEILNQIEELTMRPGTEYRVFVLYKPKRDLVNPPDIAGSLRTSSFKVYLDAVPSVNSSNANTTSHTTSRRTINCTAESCTSLISIMSGKVVDFGSVTVGASKSSIIHIKNLSALSARIEIAAISKVLSVNRNVVVVPPFENVEERLEFFPRRINDKYEKQIFVRNLLNRGNGRSTAFFVALCVADNPV